jgi:glutamate carboxypeptidase
MAETHTDWGAQTARMLQLLEQLVRLESPTTDKASVDRVGALVASELQRLQAEVIVDKQAEVGHNLYGRWGAGTGGTLILCHLDTVHPLGSVARRPIGERDGRWYGPGALDMKASLSMVLTVLAGLRERAEWPARSITALFTSDEEGSSLRSRPLIEALAREAELVLCLEPGLPDGSLKTERKGVGWMTMTALGRTAHPGTDPAKGCNAIEELAHHILAAQALTDRGSGTTVNVGVVQGGTRANVVPDEARAELNFRVASVEEADRLGAWMKSRQPVLDGARVTVTGGLYRMPMVRDETMRATFARAREIARGIGHSLTEGSTGGGSDGSLVAALGVPVLDGLGPLGDGAHTEDEYVIIASLPERAALLAALLTDW